MDSILNFILSRYELFLLCFVRSSGIFFISPFFSSQNVPNTIKIGFTFFMSLILTTTLNLNIEAQIQEYTYIVLIVKELMIGFIIGFISYLFFNVFYIFGQIVDMSIGIGMINVIDPQNGVQIPLMGNFYYMIAFLLMLGMDGHHSIIRALADSYELMPIGGFSFDMDIGFFIVDIFSRVFTIGFKLSVPIVLITLLINLLLGILVKTMPQMNVFVVGLPLKILVGFAVIAITIPLLEGVSSNILDQMVNAIYEFLRNTIN